MNLGFLLILFTFISLTGAEQFKCPSPAELNGCLCKEGQLRCPSSAGNLHLNGTYSFSSVVIEKGDDILKLFEQTSLSSLKTDTLIVRDALEGEAQVQNLAAVLSIVTRSLFIKGTNESTLDTFNLRQETLESIIIDKMKLRDIDFRPLRSLKQLELNEVTFQEEQLILDLTSLHQITIEQSANLKRVDIESGRCAIDDWIHINLRENPILESFNFEELNFANPGGCHYHIDLTGSSKLNQNILARNQDKINKAARGQLNLIMGKVQQRYTVCLQKLATDPTKHKDFLHSIQCSNEGPAKNLYLTDLKDVTGIDPTDCKP